MRLAGQTDVGGAGLKILYHHRLGSKDGQYVHVEELTTALERAGHSIVMSAPSRMGRASFGADSGIIARFKRWMPRAMYEILEFAYSVPAYRRLMRATREHRPDCLYERYSLFLPAGVWWKRRTGLPMMLEVNAPLCEERSRYGGIALRRFARRTERIAWLGADMTLPVTEVLARHLRVAGVPDSRITVIPNGIDPRRFERAPTTEEAKQALGLDGRLVLGFTGFVREWHRLDQVIDLLAERRADDLHLLVVGDGPERERLEAHARDRDVEGRVRFTGIVDRDQVADHVAAFDVALQPAVVAYASPLKLFEYLALGKAVVAPDTDNIREILTDGVDGVLFEAGNADAFRAAVERVCADPSLRARLGDRARRLIVDRGFTWDRNAETVVETFRRLGVRS